MGEKDRCLPVPHLPTHLSIAHQDEAPWGPSKPTPKGHVCQAQAGSLGDMAPPPPPPGTDLCGAPNHQLGPGLAGTQGSPSSCHEAAGRGRKSGACRRGQPRLPRGLLPRPVGRGLHKAALRGPPPQGSGQNRWPLSTAPLPTPRPTHHVKYQLPLCRLHSPKKKLETFPEVSQLPVGVSGWAGRVGIPLPGFSLGHEDLRLDLQPRAPPCSAPLCDSWGTCWPPGPGGGSACAQHRPRPPQSLLDPHS